MITDRIKALFQFIEFLHSNIENFKQYDEVINEIFLLREKSVAFKPRENFADKFKFDELKALLISKEEIIRQNVITPIRNKANELDVCSSEDKVIYNWQGVEDEIHNLKRNPSKEDLPEIFNKKEKYLEFRKYSFRFTRKNWNYSYDLW